MIALSAKSVLCLPLPPQSQCCGREFGISVSRARQKPFPTLRLGGKGGWWVRLGKLQLSFAPGGAKNQQTHVSSITFLVNMFSSRLNYFQFRVLLKDVLLGHGGTPSQLSSIIFHNVFLIGSSFASPTNQSWPHRHPCHLLAHHAAPIVPMASFGRN